MPRVFKYPPAHVCRQSGVQQPVPIPYIVLNRPVADPFPRDGKLTAAWHSDNIWDLRPREELHEPAGKLHCRRVVGVLWLLLEISCRLELRWAPDGPGTAQIGVPGRLDKAEIQISD